MPRWALARSPTSHLWYSAGLEGSARAFARFILDHGREWDAQRFTGGYSKGISRRCFGNAQDILFHENGIADGLVYVEGYACSGSLTFPFPTHHAWLVDPQGRVLDPTWDDPETSTYFGVPFNSEYVRRTVRAAGVPCSLIDNFHDRWELIRTPALISEAVLGSEAGIELAARG